jgi:hypothetical protein
LVRLVESQEQVATNRLVGSLEEQALLEALLEHSKPVLPDSCGDLHYLLATPFRYPPLRHGSRFSTRFDPSLFYGARNTQTVLAEAAYYRLVFWCGMAAAPVRPLVTQHTLFGVAWKVRYGLRLQMPPFDDYRETLVAPSSYAATQRLGTAMRNAGIEAFEYVSARDPLAGVNIALFTPGAFASPRPAFMQPWLADTDGDGVRFYSVEDRKVHHFTFGQFVVDGVLPAPAL